MPSHVGWITANGKYQEVKLTVEEQGALSLGGKGESGYVTFIDLYATHEEAQAIADQHLRGQRYFLCRDVIERNGLHVYRIYLTSKAQHARLASLYFDAWNSCPGCKGFNVSFYNDGLFYTAMFCHDCRLNFQYRPGKEYCYTLAPSPRQISVGDTRPSYPEPPKVLWRYDLYRHKETRVIYRPFISPIEWRNDRGLFFPASDYESGRTTYRFINRADLEFYAVNVPIYE